MKKHLLIIAITLTFIGLKAQSPISSATDLETMSMDGNYYLTTDVEVEDWTPLGVFTGTLDGRGHVITIANGVPDGDGRLGLFAQTNGAEIRNLFIEGQLFWPTTACGGIVAHAINTSILNCETALVMATHSTTAVMGGVVGIMEGGVIENSSGNNSIEGYLIGGIAGTTTSTSAIRNCYANLSCITRENSLSKVGLLVYENHGALENNYTKTTDNAWFIPSIGQLNLIYCLKAIFLNLSTPVDYYDGYCLSSTMPQSGYLQSISETGMLTRRSIESYNNSSGGLIRLAHEVYGVGYNIGDIVMISGTKSVIFYINEDGYGGLATPCDEDIINTALVSLSNSATSAYYLAGNYIELLDKDYAQTHDGQVINGTTVTPIPTSCRQNAGKLFTRLLGQNDFDLRHKINKLKPRSMGTTSSAAIKQLAYTNAGQINDCYYPYATGVFALVNSGSVSRGCRYSASEPPYTYGEYGSRLYEGSTKGPKRLSDTLNVWVNSHGTEAYASWTNPTSIFINDDNPVLKYGFSDGSYSVNTVTNVDKKNSRKVLRYFDLNHMPSAYTTVMSEHAYYSQLESMSVDNVTSAWNSPLFLTEEATLKGTYKLTANACVLFDNSDASGFAGANYDWHMFSSPFTNAPVGINYNSYTNGGAHGTPSQVKFNNDAGYFPTNTPYAGWDFYCYYEPYIGWVNFKRKKGDHYNPNTGTPISYSNETNLIPGKGYLWAINAQTCLMGEGKLNNGDINFTLSKKANQYSGYNLVGNPYLAFLDMDAFCADNSGVLQQQAYVLLDADRQGYICYSPLASDNPVYAPRYLHPHQGFFVQATSDNAVLSFHTSQTVVTASTDFREEKENYPLVNLVLTDAQGKKEYVTLEINRPETGGALKMKGLTNCMAELSVSQEANDYAIAFVTSSGNSVPIHLEVHTNGNYSLCWTTCHGRFEYLHLIDNLMGKEVDCLTESSYAFVASTLDYPSRFKLVYKPFNDLDELSDDEVFAVLQGKELVVRGRGQLELFDLPGRLLRSEMLTGSTTRIPMEGLTRGVYLLRLSESHRIHVQKLILP